MLHEQRPELLVQPAASRRNAIADVGRLEYLDSVFAILSPVIPFESEV